MSEFESLAAEDAEYVLNLVFHLAKAGLTEDLCELLTEFEFLEHKVSMLTTQRLIDDYELALKSSIQIPESKK